MVDLRRLAEDSTGEARRFAQSIATVWDFFASYETPEPVVRFEFDDGMQGAGRHPDGRRVYGPAWFNRSSSRSSL